MRISTEALSGLTIANGASTMYYVQFGVEWIDPSPSTPTLPIPTLEDVIGVASDVNNVYVLLKDYLLNLDANCLSQNDYQYLLRNYMFLYAHTEAMRLERFDEAEMFYDIIKKSFTNCISDRSNNTRNINSCNCN
jgi:hypothetical protein